VYNSVDDYKNHLLKFNLKNTTSSHSTGNNIFYNFA